LIYYVLTNYLYFYFYLKQDQMGKTSFFILGIMICFLNSCTKEKGTFTDSRDGTVYKEVVIGTQTWMSENLAYLPTVSKSGYSSLIIPCYYVYDYKGTDVSEAKSTDNYKTYGVLYNWQSSTNACPSGWHLPSEDEWTILTSYIIDKGYFVEGRGEKFVTGKSVGSKSGWKSDSTSGNVGNDQSSNNIIGFNALPAGSHISNAGFYYIGEQSCFWSATEYFQPTTDAYQYDLRSHNDFGFIGWPTTKEFGASVRCIKDR
jgi:uncharacterized protein (TIGR02145 family)